MPNGSASSFGEMTSVRGQRQPAQKGRAFKALSDWFNDRNHENPLASNKPRPLEVFKASIRPSKTLEAPTRPSEAPILIFLSHDIARYIQKDIDHFL